MIQKMKSRKGFTLIEMLVVIAIIAVLVAIIVPTVSSSTAKARAATDAANLRSAQATLTIKLLDGTVPETITNETVGIPKESKYDSDDEFNATVTAAGENGTGGTVNVYYGNHAITYYASIAEGGAADTSDDKSQ